MSDWNDCMERLLALDLGVEEYRLAIALARNLLGFRRQEDRIGRGLLRQEARLHGQSFDRALAALIEKGLVYFEPGEKGRGKRAFYRLLLDDENAAPQRPFVADSGNAAPARHFSAENAAENAALERLCIKQGKNNYRSERKQDQGKLGDPADLGELADISLARASRGSA